MTARQWLVSVLIVWHMAAVLVNAVPDPSRAPAFVAAEPASGWRGLVSAGLDAIGEVWAPVPRAIGYMVRPIRQPFDFYIRLAGLGQSWAMFANPPRIDQYLRVRYYVRSSSGRLWMATQLVLPAHREDQVRLLQSYRDSYLDKAFAVAIDNFSGHRRPALIRADTRPEELPDDLAPIARYYSRLFAKQLRNSGDRVVRTEVWLGIADNLPPGREPDQAMLNARHAALQTYYEGIVEQRLSVPPYPPYRSLDEEADIKWLLEYYEEP